jgi:hypothetical protein
MFWRRMCTGSKASGSTMVLMALALRAAVASPLTRFIRSHNVFVPVVAFTDHVHPASGSDEVLGHSNFDLHVSPTIQRPPASVVSHAAYKGAITTLKTSVPWMTFDTSSATHALADNPVVAKAVGASLRPVRRAPARHPTFCWFFTAFSLFFFFSFLTSTLVQSF